MHIRTAGLARCSRPLAPGKRDAGDLVVAQVGERADMPRRRDDDLVLLEDRVEIRDDANRPARRVGIAAARADREGLGRRSLFPPFAERTRDELLFGR